MLLRGGVYCKPAGGWPPVLQAMAIAFVLNGKRVSIDPREGESLLETLR